MPPIKVSIDPAKVVKPLGDLFGIFLEDINHAVDGGLYAELIQNGSFEYNTIDNKTYTGMTGWETEENDGMAVYTALRTATPRYPQNPTYLQIEFRKTAENSCGGVVNQGFHGINVVCGQAYACTFSARARGEQAHAVSVSLVNAENAALAAQPVSIQPGGWQTIALSLVPSDSCTDARWRLSSEQAGFIDIDMVSLLPEAVFPGQTPRLRQDIAQLLSDLKPKFVRFPGGCLVPDGSLDTGSRDSMYRWKDTIGAYEERPARRNCWGYNQSFGIGYYEYFLLCEDLGAKAIPVVSAGNRGAVCCPPDELQEWIDDALDLIAFANEDSSTKWGAVRASLGHPEPFHLEYLAIGNEEVGETFFSRYPYFHKAIRERYPEIKLVNSGSPFAASTEYDRGWASAREHGSDYVDEHYYQSKEWFLANMDRYDAFDPAGPLVFLGEYASCENKWHNALVEAAYMTRLERAPAVGLACYAPLLCNANYVNWRPDLIWYDNARAYGTPNYYVQKLFMQYQGEEEVAIAFDETPRTAAECPPIIGDILLDSKRGVCVFEDIVFTDTVTGKEMRFTPQTAKTGEPVVLLENVTCAQYTLTLKAKKTGCEPDDMHVGKNSFRIAFGSQDKQNTLSWELGGWGNGDCSVQATVDGCMSVLHHTMFRVELGQTYALKLVVNQRQVQTYINGRQMNDAVDKLPVVQPLYACASRSGDTVYVKLVNVEGEHKRVELDFGSAWDAEGEAAVLQCNDLRAENSFDRPERVAPLTEKVVVQKGRCVVDMLPHSVIAAAFDAAAE